jgi:APA family basic amino acid/polyamine antiporter
MLNTGSFETPLARGLTLSAAMAVVVGDIIGTGVFLKARVMTCNVGAPGLVLTAWIVAGLLVLAGALTYAELAAMMPQASGEYVFMRKAYGDKWAFLYGWMQSTIGYPGSQAAKGAAFAIFLNILIGGRLSADAVTIQFFGHQFPVGSLQLIAVAAIAVFTLVNCAAISVTGRLAVALTFTKIALIVAIALGAFLFGHGSWSHFATREAGSVCEDVSGTARLGLGGFGAAMLGALWAYDGWSNMAVIAGEVENPRRTIPIGLIGGVVIVIALYLFVNVAYFYVLTASEVANTSISSSVAAEVARRFLGSIAASFVAASMLSSTLGSLHAGTLAGARVPYVLSRDQLFFRDLARVSPRSRVPRNAVLWIGLWAAIFAISGSFDTLTDSVIFAEFLFYAMVAATVFVFRRKLPDAERPYRTWGYPIVPALFVAISASVLVSTLWTAPFQSLLGLGLIGIGLPLYWFWSARNRARIRSGSR